MSMLVARRSCSSLRRSAWREYLNGELPLAFQPEANCRQLRRLVAMRENLVARRTSLRNGTAAIETVELAENEVHQMAESMKENKPTTRPNGRGRTTIK